MSALNDQAIQAALRGAWHTAISLNQKILDTNPNDTDALNRIAYAYAKSGQFEKACKSYKQVLKLDAYNPIASKNLSKYRQYPLQTDANKSLYDSIAEKNGESAISPAMFLSDAQNTKTINLVNIAARQTLERICIGEQVYPFRKRFELQIKNSEGVYIGALPDDIGRTLIHRIEKKRLCEFYIKDIQDKAVTVFIKYSSL